MYRGSQTGKATATSPEINRTRPLPISQLSTLLSQVAGEASEHIQAMSVQECLGFCNLELPSSPYSFSLHINPGF